MTQFIAHRGLSGRYPENTHLAFRKAWEADCDGIELDIQVSKDSQVLVIHDPDTQRTAGEQHWIAETAYADLLHLNVGLGGKGGHSRFCERIPLLTDVIAEMPSGKIVQIEIKHQIVNMDAVIAVLSNLRTDIGAQIISFDTEKLLRVRRELPHLACFLVMDAEQPPIADRLGFAVAHGLAGLDSDYQLATPDFSRAVLDAGLQLAHWTVNDSASAKRLMAQGAGFLASDFADELMRSVAP
ncbi:MAG: hypothetical protein CR974_01605 [Gammaproteobacteria bacterium]|nr:MAG: hypothetical protein CR974_01605 [Gammaproteobacteria bacterium]